MEPEKVEHAISFIMGENHAYSIICRTLAYTHSDPHKLLSLWDGIDQSGLAALEAQPIPDVGIAAYQRIMQVTRKSLEAAAENRQPTNPEIDAEVALGEGLGASLLVRVLLKSLVQKGLLSDPEIVHFVDHALLGMEKLQGTSGAPKKAVARARSILEGLLSSYSPSRPKP